MRLCEIIYTKDKDGDGWKWRPVTDDAKAKPSEETYRLFYECVMAARSNGYNPKMKCR